MASIRDTPPDPQYLDAFLQGARFALFALEGRLEEDSHDVCSDLDHTLDELHDLFSSTRDGIDAREAPVSLTDRYIGKN